VHVRSLIRANLVRQFDTLATCFSVFTQTNTIKRIKRNAVTYQTRTEFATKDRDA
jgi:hypothetical protein